MCHLAACQLKFDICVHFLLISSTKHVLSCSDHFDLKINDSVFKTSPNHDGIKCIFLLISSPVLLVLLVFAGHPPAVHGVVDAGLAQLVRRGHVQHEVQLVPALVDVAQVQSGEVCKNWILEEGDKQRQDVAEV